MYSLRIFETKKELQQAVAKHIIATANSTIEKNGRFSIALSGGKTPEGLFKLLALPDNSEQLNWNKIFIFWGDERCVPMDNERNNSYNATKLLLGKVHLPAENIFRINTNLSPADAAKDYEYTLKNFFSVDEPSFDLILLGMGTNGHTASLFPHSKILSENIAWVKDVYVEEEEMYRISFTAKLINEAAEIIFLVSGNEKAAMLKNVLEGPYRPEKFPAQLIKPKNNNLYWYLDKEAASQLKNT